MTNPDDPQDDGNETPPASEPPHAEAPPDPSMTPHAGAGPRPAFEYDEEEVEETETEEEPEPRRVDESETRETEHRESRRHRRSGFEGLLRDSFRKAVERGLEVGLGTLKSADHVVRNVADEVRIPKELSNYLFSQIDETKNVLIRAVASEVREFLDATDLATEMQRALTALSFEVRMEIRFIPNEAGELKPSVKAKAAPRARRPERRPRARREEDEE